VTDVHRPDHAGMRSAKHFSNRLATPALSQTLQCERKHQRYRTLKSGRIFHNLGRSSLDVRITDMSEGGARLHLDTIWLAPPVFNLHILNPNTGKPASIWCAIVWHCGYKMGVRKIDLHIVTSGSESRRQKTDSRSRYYQPQNF
jgi:hypothetical protein